MANLDDNNSWRSQEQNINLSDSGGMMFAINQGFTWITYLFALITVTILFLMTFIVFKEAQPAIEKFGLGFLWGKDWDTSNEIFGALPYIYGTLVSSAIAIVFTIPVSISVALVTSEDFLPPSIKNTLAFVVELIAAIPSVIIGLWGIAVFIPVIEKLQKWLAITFKFIPLFNTEDPTGNNMFTAGLILAIMILPTMAAISRDVLLVIPKELRLSLIHI